MIFCKSRSKENSTVGSKEWQVHNPAGSKRVVVTKELPGKRWLDVLVQAGCKVEVCSSSDILSAAEIKTAIGNRCAGAIGQITESWGEEMFATLANAGGKVYSNYAVGFDNVDLNAATRHGIAVGNTPGVLTETTAQMAVALTFAAARRVSEAERFLREGRYKGWLPTLFLGNLLWRKTLGVIGAGRIGTAYALMMVEGHKMDLIYFDPHAKRRLEDYISGYNGFLAARKLRTINCKRADQIEDLLREADCVSIHTILNESTHHLINKERLALMKDDAILINTSRGPVIDEAALVEHCRAHPRFKVGLDVFEHEPETQPGLLDLDNVVKVPHIASATSWTRRGMATLAASNVAAILMGQPAWQKSDIAPFLEGPPPAAAPSILNAKELSIPQFMD
jgi:hydroxypyruvate reductase 1